tara:strand:- start:3099 stop:3743 length:645 start_codon:yes stop_codon:yes gene_type:complete
VSYGKFQAAIFDYGGVMAKSPLGRIEMLATQFKADKEAIIQLILGENADFDNPWFEAECGRQPLDKTFAEKMQKIFDQHDLLFNLEVFRSWVADAVNEPDLIMEELVLELKESEIKVALLTNSVPEFWPVIERTIDTKLFDCIIDSSVAGFRKPDKRIYELASIGLNVQPSSCVMIDDLAHNIDGAQNAGMQGVLFTTSEKTKLTVLKYFRSLD